MTSALAAALAVGLHYGAQRLQGFLVDGALVLRPSEEVRRRRRLGSALSRPWPGCTRNRNCRHLEATASGLPLRQESLLPSVY